MSNNALREGFREIARDPALLLIEVGWRWAFGIIAIVVCATVLIVSTKGIIVEPRSLESSSTMDPWRTAQSIAAFLLSMGGVLVRAVLLLTGILAFCWTILSSLGRRATVLRAALAPGADLRVCFKIHALRTLITLGALLAWILSGVIAGLLAAATSSNGVPNFWLALLILAPVMIVILSAWSAGNWYLSLAPLFRESSLVQSIRSVWRLCKTHRDAVLEISILTAAIRFVLIIAALLLSFAIGAVITNARIVFIDLITIALLYFLAADFVSVARLAAFAKLRDSQIESAINLSGVLEEQNLAGAIHDKGDAALDPEPF